MISDELPDECNLIATEALATVDRHGSSVTERVSERKQKIHRVVTQLPSLDLPPLGSGIDVGVARREQHLRLMHAQCPGRLLGSLFCHLWPPAKASFRQALGRQPKSLPIVDQHLDRGRGSNEIQHTDWGLSSSSTVGTPYMGRSFGCTGEPFTQVRPSFTLTPMRRCPASCLPGWLMLRSAGEWSSVHRRFPWLPCASYARLSGRPHKPRRT